MQTSVRAAGPSHTRMLSLVSRANPEQLFLTATVVGGLAVKIACLPFRQAPDRDGEVARHPRQCMVCGPDSALRCEYRPDHTASLPAGSRMRGAVQGISDAQIAAVAKVHDMAVATRNVADFEQLGVSVINPWAPGWRRGAWSSAWAKAEFLVVETEPARGCRGAAEVALEQARIRRRPARQHRVADIDRHRERQVVGDVGDERPASRPRSSVTLT